MCLMLTHADSHTVLSPLEWTLYQGCPHLRVLRHTHDHKHLLRLGKYVTQQNLVNINMERKKNYLLSCLVCVMKTTYSHAFLTPQFALIKMLCNIWPLQWKIVHAPDQPLINYMYFVLQVLGLANSHRSHTIPGLSYQQLILDQLWLFH